MGFWRFPASAGPSSISKSVALSLPHFVFSHLFLTLKLHPWSHAYYRVLKKPSNLTPQTQLQTYGHPLLHKHTYTHKQPQQSTSLYCGLVIKVTKGQPIQGFLDAPLCMAHISCMVLTWCVSHLFKTKDIEIIWIERHHAKYGPIWRGNETLRWNTKHLLSFSVTQLRNSSGLVSHNDTVSMLRPIIISLL